MRLSRVRRLFLIIQCIGLQLVVTACAKAEDPLVLLPKSGLLAKDLAVIVNTMDPLSVQIGEYYQKKRRLKPENMIEVAFKPGQSTMSAEDFAIIKAQVDRQTPSSVQAYALTWAAPYRVECMSITTAFAMGYDLKYCATGCEITATSPYAESDTLYPYDKYGIRPTMSLAAGSLADAKALINRGVIADGWAADPSTVPAAYLLETSDSLRSVRKVYFPSITKDLSNQVKVRSLQKEGISNREDVMFYFTGAAFVKSLEKNAYLPGAMADHLTSSGGKLTNSKQMSALRWLQVGATGSYGTVVEPCNYTQKFPNPYIAMQNYLGGSTLIEAYWKSVVMPGQGIFIGEPLASPYRGYSVSPDGNRLRIRSNQLTQGRYRVFSAQQREGPFSLEIEQVSVGFKSRSIWVRPPFQPVYKIVRR
ncbi:MAG: TIGR03790 family protein [Halioglobus sp.]